MARDRKVYLRIKFVLFFVLEKRYKIKLLVVINTFVKYCTMCICAWILKTLHIQ